MSRAPFQQLPFAALPALPRIPHPYFSTPARELSLHSTAFGDVRVHCRVHGSGPPLLLVHGLMTSSYSFRYVLEPLGQHFTVYVPDLPGSGRSSMPDRSYHPDRYAEFLGELIDALGIRGCRTVGNSLGGYLAMRLALRDRGAMSRLLNLHSPGIPLPRLHALRMALGASPERVARAVVMESVGLAAAGSLLGLAGAVAGGRFARAVLFGVAPQDPITLVASVAVLLLVVVAASWLPARRASLVDPSRAMRL